MMKYVLLLPFLALVSCNQPTATSQENSGNATTNQWIVQDHVTKWENNKKYTMAILEAMPAEHYGFIPSDDMRTFSGQAIHLGESLKWQLEKAIGTELAEIKGDDKASIIKSLGGIYDEVIAALKGADGNKLSEETSMWYGESTHNRILNLMDSHHAHHRGQMIVYLRLKGGDAPKYIGW